ncbi:hypothetical protein BBF96_00050 [Anoxybacter fermentans]|uniref:CYTH domain-containing protein n=1 Tax=Anoxybacter fermentans TaxID=1323375 RepID=A0A3Q9HND1_9FIRM|nr:CYTH domain-containing protein [Anoxybacter fermentans]AZR71936.1 hypothetical protein BBF96_00050 [Anoxybacter fermentans]
METEVKYIVDRNMEELEKDLKTAYKNLIYIGELNLPAIYYDTDDGNLAKQKNALRARKEGGKWIGCYKAVTSQERRFVEEEVELTEEELNQNDWFVKLKHYPQIKKLVGDSEVKAILKIDTRRKVYLLKLDNLQLEIVLDWVNYLDGVAEERRLEVELKKGNIESFNEFLNQFVKKIRGLKETNISKYQRARELLNSSA